ncbi:uncharacterized protein LOC105844922 [Hydra vulgaris]|uniref:uncharacterized protein LOC105844922 n=1 Tax=Hydra vulgaris TaxID=6087 RepID=UPI001F5EDEAD|nr:uncharacterized protein LOC105844922 [Hydra vulgaris]
MGLWLTPHHCFHLYIVTHKLYVLVLFLMFVGEVLSFRNYDFENRLKNINTSENKFRLVELFQKDKLFDVSSLQIKSFINSKNIDLRKLNEKYIHENAQFFNFRRNNHFNLSHYDIFKNEKTKNGTVLQDVTSLNTNDSNILLYNITKYGIPSLVIDKPNTPLYKAVDSNISNEVYEHYRNKSLNDVGTISPKNSKFSTNRYGLLKGFYDSKNFYITGFKRRPVSDLHSRIIDFFTEQNRQSPNLFEDIGILDSKLNKIDNKNHLLDDENIKDNINLLNDHEILSKEVDHEVPSVENQETADENHQIEQQVVSESLENFDQIKDNKTLQQIQPSASIMEYLEDPMEFSGEIANSNSFEMNEDKSRKVYPNFKFSFSFQNENLERSGLATHRFNNASGNEDKEPIISSSLKESINSSSLPNIKEISLNHIIKSEPNEKEMQDIIINAIHKNYKDSKNFFVDDQSSQDEKIIHAVNTHAFNQSNSKFENFLKNENVSLTDEHNIKFYSINNHNNQAHCIDGSPPGYYLRKGWNNGATKWIIHLHGGAWCYNVHSCSKRRGTILGSTKNSAKENINSFFHGILSKNQNVNPNFFNWNVVVLSYCDGGLFSGNRKKFLIGKGKIFYFQGRKILKVLIEDLYKKSLQSATDVVLSGTSAGGLAVVLQGDYMRHFLPKNANVRGLCDAGIFLDRSSSLGIYLARQQFKALYSLHKPILNKECLASFSRKEKFLCLFPEYALKYLKLPIFLVNSLYDHWQLSELEGIQCVYDQSKCNTKQHDLILNFRNHMYSVLTKIKTFKKDTGVFANSCLVHGQAIIDYTWSKVRINNSSIEDSFFKWFLDRNLQSDELRHFKADCKFPCNGTCPKVLAQRCVQIFKGTSEIRRRRDAEIC